MESTAGSAPRRRDVRDSLSWLFSFALATLGAVLALAVLVIACA